MEYKNIEKSKRQKRLIRIDIITSGLYIVFIAVIGVRLYFANYNFGYFKVIESKWKARAINSFNGFDPFEIGEIPQNFIGCYCQNQNKAYNGTCTDSQKNSNCTIIQANTLKLLFYIERTPSTIDAIIGDYSSLLKRINEQNNCQEGYKRCGNLDTLDQPFCQQINENKTENTTDCPIESIAQYSTCNNWTDNKYSVLNFKSLGMCWVAKRAEDNNTSFRLISNIMFSEDKPCLNGLETNVQFFNYPLFDYSNGRTTCSFYVNDGNDKIKTNDNYKEFGTVNDFKSVIENNNLMSRFNSFKGLDSSLLSRPMHFDYSTYIGHKKSCVKTIQL